MYLIVGLGNPGDKYLKTYHNLGYMSIDILADKLGVEFSKTKFNAQLAQAKYRGETLLLTKPLTFMNLSGESVRELIDYYKIDEEDLIIIYDDISLDPGKIRLRRKGSAGGHNGIKSIIQHLGSDVFPRVKVGVGSKPKEWDLVDHVLGRFSDEDRVLVEESIRKTSDAIVDILNEDIGYAMNNHN